jgi:predicted O-linked N-acetylglucosamine transferase (SPINDLY family)
MSPPPARSGLPPVPAPPALHKAGELLRDGKFEEARTILLRAVQQKSPHPHGLYMLGLALDGLSQLDQARFYFEKALSVSPHEPMLAIAVAHANEKQGKRAEGLKVLEAFAAANPLDASIACALTSYLTELDRTDEAVRIGESARAKLGDHPDLCNALGRALHKAGRPDEAIEVYKRGERLIRAGSTLMNLGRIPEAVEVFRGATLKYPDDEAAWTNYAFTLSYVDGAPVEEMLRAHREFARAVRMRLGAPYSAWNVSKDPDRKLRVGIVSPDLRIHAIVSFLAPLLESYDRSDWHLTAYSTGRVKDKTTERIKSLVDEWREPRKPHPRYLAGLIHADRIDVLIDLSGHTEENSLPAFHLRPAPVQATYLGYPNTTGLDTIDIRIVDSITDPPGYENRNAERLVRIDPCFLCFKPIVDAPDLAPPPCTLSGATGISFGSFNLPLKIGPRTLSMWSAVLRAMPTARLVLKHASMAEPWMREHLARRTSEVGIDQSRITVLPPAPAYRDHLGAYAKVDIGLDTYPYHGTTTTCEALWMGVPTVTLLGDRHASRVGASLLGAVGLSDLIAKDEEDFARIATTLAANTDRLKAWRTPGAPSLREQMASSTLCDGKAFASRFQAAIRQAWRDWCAQRKS